MHMNKKQLFRKQSTYVITNDLGVTVTFFLKGDLHYEEKGRSIVFEIRHFKLAEIVPTYAVYIPNEPKWTETNEPITREELQAIKENLVAASPVFGVSAFLVWGDKAPPYKKVVANG